MESEVSFHPRKTPAYKAARSVARVLAGSRPTQRKACLIWHLNKSIRKSLFGAISGTDVKEKTRLRYVVSREGQVPE